jgi:hypothetical protein
MDPIPAMTNTPKPHTFTRIRAYVRHQSSGALDCGCKVEATPFYSKATLCPEHAPDADRLAARQDSPTLIRA